MLKDVSHDWTLIPTVSLIEISSAVNRAEVCVTGGQQLAGGLDGTNSVREIVPDRTVLPTATSQCLFKGGINVYAFPHLGFLQPVPVSPCLRGPSGALMSSDPE